MTMIPYLAVNDAKAAITYYQRVFGDREVSNNNGHRSGWFYDPWGHRWSPTSDVM